ncbi:hypothetical protein ACJRO7_033951 [Eucalyptus globulus]|uniref:WAT1-related protein n=1 Tax=Eucalyptus globulus TaxID=34317 RepID=A0ABD3J735_EUCGL
MGLKNPYVFAISIQIIQASMTLFTKAAINGGMKSMSVFVFYRLLFGSVFLFLLSAIFERRSTTPLTFLIFFKISVVAFLSHTLTMNLYGIALLYTSASLVATATNCVPVTTFFFAVLLGKEKVNVREIAGAAKLGGITICIVGGATLAFFNGPILNTKWIVGCFLSFLAVSSWGLAFVLQAGVLETYPSKLHFTSLQCLSSTVQSFLVAITVERDLSEWKLAWNVRLLAVLYCGFVVTGVSHYLQSWVIAMKGPVFLGMSTPLSPIPTMIGSMFLFGENMNLGSIVGEIILVAGLYSVLWGQTHEQNLATKSSLPVHDEKTCVNAEDKEPKDAQASYLAK